MEIDEVEILKKIALAYDENFNTYYDALDEITGLFVFGYIENKDISFIINPTGLQCGIDSNTTFAVANGNYDKYETFSYLSAPKEVQADMHYWEIAWGSY